MRSLRLTGRQAMTAFAIERSEALVAGGVLVARPSAVCLAVLDLERSFIRLAKAIAREVDEGRVRHLTHTSEKLDETGSALFSRQELGDTLLLCEPARVNGRWGYLIPSADGHQSLFGLKLLIEEDIQELLSSVRRDLVDFGDTALLSLCAEAQKAIEAASNEVASGLRLVTAREAEAS